MTISLLCVALQWTPSPLSAAAGTTYYVAAGSGSDANDGLSPAAPLQTIARVNVLPLAPGDRVLFRCGDTWRGEMLRITRSGAAGAPITFGSYPTSTCADQPTLSGAQPIATWAPHASNLYVADLAAPANATAFPPATTSGINQLFRNGQRLGIGRWPNLDAPDGGYATLDAQPAGNRLTAGQLPAGDWTGASAHIRGMRWYLLNRTVTGSSGSTLTLNHDAGCWGGDCTGWGFWLSGHLATLDREGEWYYDPAARKVYLYTTGDPNAALIEGSVVVEGESANLGGVILGRHLQEHIAHVVIETLAIEKWFDHGITTPVNLEKDEHFDIVIRNNAIRDVDGTGINLATWVWNAAANGNGPDGWRGGRDIQLTGNVIERANAMGINSYARQSTIEGNTIRDVALIANLGTAGMGCSTTSGEGACTEDGDGIRIKADEGDWSGNNVVIRRNHLENIGYNGMDLFGHSNTVEENLIRHACISKGDCGGLRSFGRGSLATTEVHDLAIHRNIIEAPIGNTDGCHSDFDALFGFGLYLDHFSRDVAVTDNTIFSATASGLLFQNSTGTATGNTLFANAAGTMSAWQATVTGNPSQLADFSGNLLLGKQANAGTLRVDAAGQLAHADGNGFYHVDRAAHISAAGNKTLAQWQSATGHDPASTELISTTLTTAELFYNATSAPVEVFLSRPYVDLSGQTATNPLILAPYTSQVLLPAGPAAPQLAVTAAAPALVAAGLPVTYTLEVANRGSALAADIIVTSTLPAGTTHLAGGTLAGDEVAWAIDQLESGEARQLSLTVLPAPGTTLIVLARYGATAEGGFHATGQPAVTIAGGKALYLPQVER